MPNLALILHDGSSGPREHRLGRILDFFGVPWEELDATRIQEKHGNGLGYAVFGSIRAIASALNKCEGDNRSRFRPAAYYAYLDDDLGLCDSSFRALLRDWNLSLQEAPPGPIAVNVADDPSDVTGPMTSLKLSVRLAPGDAVLRGEPADKDSKFERIISAGDAALFVRFQHNGAAVYFCTSSGMVDLDETIEKGFYDVKQHFCSAVSLVIFIKATFPDVAWRPQELGACLIIDDPLLKSAYGFCDFLRLRDLMRKYGFTTNIAFIPWNWHRTSPSAAKLFSDGSGRYSVSIHGCDHIRGEFGATSAAVLDHKAELAQSRMRSHEARTGIRHDPIMVFPQGVFSSECPRILKQNGFLAAINTELAPVDSQNARTRIRDVWDVAIMTYGSFPIFTRRYPFHGLENFAFDLLLGKPCLIVAHHDDFQDGGTGLIELIENLGSLNCRLQWRHLGDVIRKACRLRSNEAGTDEVEMYGNELLIENPSDQMLEVKIRRRKSQDDVISEILCDEMPITWSTGDEHYFFGERISPGSGKRFKIVYRVQTHAAKARRSLRFELSVAIRRALSEFRDDYLAKSRLLSVPAGRLKNAFRKVV